MDVNKCFYFIAKCYFSFCCALSIVFGFVIRPIIALVINKIASSIKGMGSGIKKLMTVSKTNAMKSCGYFKVAMVLRTNCDIKNMFVTRINKKRLGLTIA
ncbi:MAG: hypothetical protein MI750_09600 [Xanthomonadales bacterium]|nr:hypothetical protein [Xanthomonadales bacterium]